MANQLKDLTIADGATVSTTGGTAVTVAEDTRGLDRVDIVASADALATQRRFAFSKKAPKASTSNPTGYTQARSRLYISYPRTLASGAINIDSVTVEISHGIATTAADILNMQKNAAQALIDADLVAFWSTMSLG